MALVALLAVASFGVQRWACCSTTASSWRSLLPFSPDPDRLTLVDPARQPILNQMRLLRPGGLDFAWQRGGAAG